MCNFHKVAAVFNKTSIIYPSIECDLALNVCGVAHSPNCSHNLKTQKKLLGNLATCSWQSKLETVIFLESPKWIMSKTICTLLGA